jgi:hypothetical protein
MNDPHKFSTEFGSDHALEQSAPIVSHHDTIKWFECNPRRTVVYSGSRNTGEWPLCNYGKYRGARHSNTYALPCGTADVVHKLNVSGVPQPVPRFCSSSCGSSRGWWQASP